MNAQFDISGIRIETDRLILREWTNNDLDDFFAYASVDGVGEMAGWRHHENIDVSRTILNMFMEGKKTFALEEKATGRVIGSLGLEDVSAPILKNNKMLKGREIGYVLAKDKWGQGLMTEAVKKVLAWIFENTDWDFVSCGHFVRNDRSRRVIEKCGFEYIEDSVYTTRMNTQEPTRNYVIYRENYRK